MESDFQQRAEEMEVEEMNAYLDDAEMELQEFEENLNSYLERIAVER